MKQGQWISSFLSIVPLQIIKPLVHKFVALHRNYNIGVGIYEDVNGVVMESVRIVEQDSASLVQWVSTPLEVVRKMLELAQVGPEDIVYDLGCGDARALIMAVKEFGVQKAIGYEIRQDLYERSKQEIQGQNLQDRITLVRGDLLDADLSEASVIVLYLSPKANDCLRPKLEREVKSATRIVSYDFQINKWCPDKKVQLEDYPSSELSYTRTIYMYVVPQAFQSPSGNNTTGA
ncbi:SAM-dependent methyltransferase [Chloroflexota bacterium]